MTIGDQNRDKATDEARAVDEGDPTRTVVSNDTEGAENNPQDSEGMDS